MSGDIAARIRSQLRKVPVIPALLRDSLWVVVIALVASVLIFGVLYDLVDSAVRSWSDRDLSRRATLIWRAIQTHDRVSAPEQFRLSLQSLTDDDSLTGLTVCAADGSLLGGAGAGSIDCRSTIASEALASPGQAMRASGKNGEVQITVRPLRAGERLVIVQDRSFVASRRKHVLQAVFIGAEVAVLALLLLARTGARMGARRTGEAARSVVRQIRDGNGHTSPMTPELRLLASDVQETVNRLRAQSQRASSDGATRLREFVNREFPDAHLVVVANREPYVHERSATGGTIVQQPPSGLVTAIEPILRACGGTWIAHGSGSADRENSDAQGRVAVPPQSPEYVLRRLWIDADEYERYYFGFANEGLWPLCHIAHTRPSFRNADWTSYEAVNASFARAASLEAGSDGLLMIQDYHFALVPRMVRDAAPHIVTSLFWHIPWPNWEVIGICPWKESLLEGMLGADVVGFHTRYHCLNFLETVNRYLECRVELESMSVEYGGHRTQVRPYPISVEWPQPCATREQGAELRRSLGIAPEAHVSVGVDRADYTKGLIERVQAVELALEQNPSLIGRYVLVQLAAPTRTRIRKYRDLAGDLQEAVDKVNHRFGTTSWKPVILQMRSFSPEEVRVHYAMANSALVTPLHDGMNLVAKEYVASCEDGDGALVLSVFAGAAKDLEGALPVNPYDIEEMAQAILRAINMPLAERRARMNVMREQIASHSIYHWSEKLLADMRDVRERRSRFWPRKAQAIHAHTEIAG